jgi:L-ascorbate metabolism protein UlaG (beta-lactamase superfamily)
MKITKYPQSCLLLEKDGQKIVIDPGVHFLNTHKASELYDVKAVLYTHEHADHYEPKIADELKTHNIPLYANQSAAKLIGKGCTVVNDGDTFKVAGFSVRAYELPHCLTPTGPGPQNTGYVIDGALFHPGDGKELEGLEVPNLALPIAGPDISILDAINFADQLQAKVVIPMHFHSISLDPKAFAQYAEWGKRTFEVRILDDGESTEL